MQAETTVYDVDIMTTDEIDGELVQWIQEAYTSQGYELHGLHHEIYLGDPRKTAPEKLKTILRMPVRAKT